MCSKDVLKLLLYVRFIRCSSVRWGCARPAMFPTRLGIREASMWRRRQSPWLTFEPSTRTNFRYCFFFFPSVYKSTVLWVRVRTLQQRRGTRYQTALLIWGWNSICKWDSQFYLFFIFYFFSWCEARLQCLTRSYTCFNRDYGNRHGASAAIAKELN